jgi:signal transduction histidine kinase
MSHDEKGDEASAVACDGDTKERTHPTSAGLALQGLSPDLLDLLIEQLTLGVVVVESATGRVLLQNSGMSRILGHPLPSEGDAVEYLHRRLTPAQSQPDTNPQDLFEQVLDQGRPVTSQPFLLLMDDGRTNNVFINGTPVRDAQGSVVAALVVFHEAPAGAVVHYASPIWVRADLLASLTSSSGVRLRDTFLSTAAHELRTPLTTVSGFSQLLERQLQAPELDREELLTLAGELRGQVRRMVKLADDLMQALTLQDDLVTARRQRCDLTATALRVIERAKILPEYSEQHEIVLEAEGAVEGDCDPEHLDMILTTLISNALKYSPDGGPVRLRIRAIGDRVELTVIDYGIGISPEDQKRLWQPFVRLGPLRRSVAGTGLGLFIVRHLIERNGGTVRAESSLGIGSSFIVELPRWIAPLDADERERE